MINTIGMIGTGNMGSAILRGIVEADYVKASQIIAYDTSSRRMNELSEDLPGIMIARDCLEVAEKADLIILAIKPIYVKDVIDEIHSGLDGKAVLSIAAGWTVSMLENALYGTTATYLRVMPNTPALVGEGMTAICDNTTFSKEDFNYAKGIFDSVGKTKVLPERLFDGVVAVSGSSPAYVYMMIEAMADAAVKEGIPRVYAYEMAAQSVLGSALMVLSSGTHPAVSPEQRVLVCLDAGIATDDNLVKIREKGYDYLCVSRSRQKDYELEPDAENVKVLDSRQQPISLTRVRHEEGGDYYLEINSPGKQLKEESMNRLFKERFEKELTKARESLSKKGGKKAYEKVIERVGRAIGKYPSISKYYVIDYIRDEKNPKNMGDIQWRIAVPENVDRLSGIYFLRTNREKLDEQTTWDYYNLIREIECTNRQLKTDLSLRPIYHQKDGRSDAHLFMGLIAYWIVNTIRYRMKVVNQRREQEANKDKKPDEKRKRFPTPFWTEIVRRMSTQKAVTTEAVNAMGEKVTVRLCSTPKKEAAEIYEMLGYKKMPFWRKVKVCSTQ